VAAVVNLVLGLGGTGARLVESFVHLCAAGLGPPQASVAFIDQDQANGNTLRARTALGKYVAAHKELRKLAGEHPDPSSDLLGTQLDPHPDGADVETCHWVPQRESNATLANLIKYGLMGEGSARDLARTLFHEREELRMPLNEGYRGRPHVGAAALLAQIETDEFWRSLEDLVQNASRAVRVFLCGSVFGGTGAAVLPTLARRLRQVAEEADRPLFIAGALMLPYFTFPPAEDREANVATGHELLLQSQSALQYYHGEMEVGGKPYSFDDIYMVGWRPAIELSHHAAGAGEQVNPPLAPELFGALAAAKFFSEERAGGGGEQRPNLHVIAREAPSRLDWSDLPPVTDARSTPSACASWLRFCALWRFNYGKPFRPDAPWRLRTDSWFRNLTGRRPRGLRRDPGPDPVMDGAAGVLDEYVTGALRYAAAMSAFSTWSADSDASFNLWTHGPIAAVDRTAVTAEADLEGGALARGMETFGGLVRGFESAPDANAIFETISARPAPGSPGLWPLVAHLHACAAPSST